MKHCKKCSAGAMRVHILSSGFCQECQAELSWKNGEKIARQQHDTKRRVEHYERSKEYIKRKWRDKYGNDDVGTVLGYK
tara:strand:+ start:294 stop:530 length:237 start_codon:yes stop_codon:yes gene_type:complete